MNNALDQISTPRALATSQATVVEQSRAVAEVQAAVVVAQQVPRDMGRVLADMRDACGRTALAQRAFYSVPNRGNGASVHLARELARIWGNFQHGVQELRRDDDHGESEIKAFAWDVQANAHNSRTFIVPHARMARKQREKLVDLGDIYNNNQNVGARALRECIFAVLPTWFREEAEALCRQTLEHGEGKPLNERVDEVVKTFGSLGIKPDAIEAKLGKTRTSWTPRDVAELIVIGRSIRNGETTKDEAFPPKRVTADEITGAAPPKVEEPAGWAK